VSKQLAYYLAGNEAQVKQQREALQPLQQEDVAEVTYREQPADSTLPFGERAVVQTMLKSVEANDHIVIAHSLRTFTSVPDLLGGVAMLLERGLGVRVVDLGLNLKPEDVAAFKTAMGAAVALGRAKRAAAKECAVAEARSEGRPLGKPRYGTKHLGRRGARYEGADPTVRAIGKRCVELRAEGRSWDSVWAELRREGVRHRNKPISRTTAQNWYEAELRLQKLERAEPPDEE